MLKILIINGPNLNMLGIREPEIYGLETYETLCETVNAAAKCSELNFFQSNHEGSIIDKIQEAYGVYDAIIINPAAYTHTSIAIPDALRAVSIPTVEVHLSDIKKREEYRSISYVSEVAERVFVGEGALSYIKALAYLEEKYNNN